ncbi:response regulator transcription factor [Lachnoclostridium phytofermentans]|uniref:Stage 0 sporulation protein A homolog n=1 Tax=Lachnoclostridium phytofermentans (strain ATCC 700394 / DSM 18823 / ISDg) TaxID=357809 RepID=A9KRB5_LACP7|nr:response regulator transcription factor [Lachnoclostridium phytofermentans]ABX40583.1 two component transcriptional regulator, winged helix family [Lachnoclostridium phytofermentans ISDg]
MRILIVEDEIDLCDTIAEGLQIDGYAVDTCYHGDVAYELISTETYDLVVLDLNLPGMDGIDILSDLRKTNKDMKILILSARSSVSDKVLGLDIGANDYLAKPFAFEELEARIRSLLRRSFVQENSVLVWNEISLDTVGRTVSVSGIDVTMTKKELALLEYFLLNQSKVISQEELMEHVWNMEADSFSNAVRVHIASLRKKLKIALGYDPIATKIGEGYFLNGGGSL